jgi:hypothetical protein
VSSYGPRDVVFAGTIPSEDLRLWVATAPTTIAIFCKICGLPSRNGASAADAYNTAVGVLRLIATRLFEHLNFACLNSDRRRETGSGRFWCEFCLPAYQTYLSAISGYLAFAAPRGNRVVVEAWCADKIYTEMSQFTLECRKYPVRFSGPSQSLPKSRVE